MANVRLGPADKLIINDASGRVTFPLPRGSTLSYAGIVLRAGGAAIPNCEGSIIIYRGDMQNETQRDIALVSSGYVKTSIAWQKALEWQGDHEIPDDREYTLDMAVRNYTGATITMVATAIIQERDKKRGTKIERDP